MPKSKVATPSEDSNSNKAEKSVKMRPKNTKSKETKPKDLETTFEKSPKSKEFVSTDDSTTSADEKPVRMRQKNARSKETKSKDVEITETPPQPEDPVRTVNVTSEDEMPKPKKQKAGETKKSKTGKDANKPNKNTSSSTDKTNEEEGTWDLGNMKRVSVSQYKGRLTVDIREMYMDKDTSDIKAGTKGISLTVPQFKKLFSYMENIDKAIQAKI